ncbi:hypothetical protein [Pseudogemmobacter humi]|uniref:PhnA-like protein n=1 Tax=Pseudogemmobacter humi TaxID=2483812 RepID=A0A3P5WTV4_9RHOB|nr:hypothetical protein [Pseudogemmobacter humi]VDC25105.1 hypothetical protein XINFAN_01383 [Pseudogemmobacter humi]
MERTETMTAASAPRRELPGSYIDWPAVLGGAVVAAAIAGLFTAFGAALGLTTISAEPGEGSFSLWLIVTAIWIVISLVASYLAGGYVAGRMRRRLDDASAEEVSARDGINGLVVWGVGMLVTAWMAAGAIGGAASAVGTAATAVGSAVGGVAQATGSALGGAASAVGGAVSGGTDEGLLDYIGGTLMRPALSGVQEGAAAPAAPAPAPATPESGTAVTPAPAPAAPVPAAPVPAAPAADPAELSRQTGIILGNVLRTGEISEEDRAFLIRAVAERSGQSEAEVEARVEQAVEAVQEARAEAARLAAEAEQAAIDAAETARVSAILSAFLLTAAALVAAVAAVSGAVRGGRHRDEGRLFGGFTYRF